MWKLKGSDHLEDLSVDGIMLRDLSWGGGTDADQDTNQWLAVAKMIIILRIP